MARIIIETDASQTYMVALVEAVEAVCGLLPAEVSVVVEED